MARYLWVLVLLQGCVVNVDTAPIAAALPGLASQYGVAPTASGCASGVTPAAGIITASPELGAYAGMNLPGTFASYHAERDITERITGFARDTSAVGSDTWVKFQCLFPGAVRVWRAKASDAAAPPGQVVPPALGVPPPANEPVEPPMAVEPQPAVAASIEPVCPPEIDPANGTMLGSSALGAYDGALLPGSFTVYETQEQVTERISGFANDTSETGRNTWIKFQCFYPQAVAVWRNS